MVLASDGRGDTVELRYGSGERSRWLCCENGCERKGREMKNHTHMG